MIYHLSCAELTAELTAESVDWIITDPPYPKEFLPCWSELAGFAAHALKPGGSLLAMSGQMFIPEVYQRLESQPELIYHWQMCYEVPTVRAAIWPRRLRNGWKPILWYKKQGQAEQVPNFQITDIIRGVYKKSDRRWHKWSQVENGVFSLMARFVHKGDLIVDPFVGGGSTAIAALALGCDFIGADIDAEAVETTRRRMLEYQPVMLGV